MSSPYLLHLHRLEVEAAAAKKSSAVYAYQAAADLFDCYRPAVTARLDSHTPDPYAPYRSALEGNRRCATSTEEQQAWLLALEAFALYLGEETSPADMSLD